MRSIRCLLFALGFVAGFVGSAGAATFDFTFLASGLSIAQGSFSFPDADLSQPDVRQSYGSGVEPFTSFDLVADGYTFNVSQFYQGGYSPTTNTFDSAFAGASGVILVFNPSLLYYQSGTPNFSVSAFEFDPCYYEYECGPAYPPVFEGYQLNIYGPGTGPGFQNRVAAIGFDTIVITPATSVPEPGSAALLLASLAGLVLLARSTGRGPHFGRLNPIPASSQRPSEPS